MKNLLLGLLFLVGMSNFAIANRNSQPVSSVNSRLTVETELFNSKSSRMYDLTKRKELKIASQESIALANWGPWWDVWDVYQHSGFQYCDSKETYDLGKFTYSCEENNNNELVCGFTISYTDVLGIDYSVYTFKRCLEVGSGPQQVHCLTWDPLTQWVQWESCGLF